MYMKFKFDCHSYCLDYRDLFFKEESRQRNNEGGLTG